MKKKKFSPNFKIKILSVLVAFGMWVYVMEEIDPIMVRSLENVPIASIVNSKEITDKGLAVSYDQHLTTSIDFRGKRSSLLSFLSATPSPKGYVENPKIGENELQLSLEAPSDIEYSFDPRNFIITLEESVISEKSIEIINQGTPKGNFSVGEINLSNQRVYIEGPKGQVDKVDRLVGTVSVEGADKDFSVRIQLIPMDAKDVEVGGVIVNGEYVIADVQMEESKEVPIEIVFVNSAGEIVSNKSYKPSVDTVTIIGKPQQIATIQKVQTEKIPVQSINQFIDREFDLVSIPDVNMSVNRISIQLIQEEEILYNFELDPSKIELTNAVNDERILEALPEQINVQFRASKEYETAIDEESLRLYIDNRVDATTYQIRLSIEYPINDLLIEPNQISLN